MASKFESLIEHIVAGNEKKARSLFHSIVVEKSRKIYEDLDVERAFDDVEVDHVGDADFIGGDASDDLETDVFVDGEEYKDKEEENDDDDNLNPEIDDRVADLETQYDELVAEFEALKDAEDAEDDEDDEDDETEDEEFDADMDEDDAEEDAFDADVDEDDAEDEEIDSAVDEDDSVDDEAEGDDFDAEIEHEESEEEQDDADMDEDDAEDEEFDADMDEDDAEEDEKEAVDESLIREYVLNVTKGLANSSEEGFVQKKSPVAGKNDIVRGVTAKNIAQGGVSKGRPTPEIKPLIGDEEVVNRPGRKSVNLKNAPKPVTKEPSDVNKKSVE